MNALERAVKICEGQSELARRIGGDVKQAHVWNWLNKSNGVVPAEHCRAIELATDGRVTRYQLRPDVFGDGPEHQVSAQQVAGRSFSKQMS
jgi:DNA-binding transcriptional regulator YdaS (Cro superfamily)